MTHEESCPLCARDLAFPHQIDICDDCHGSLQLSGAVSLSTTSEFQAVRDPRESADAETGAESSESPPSQAEDAEDAGEAPRKKRPRAGTEETDSPHCSWCKKEPEDVRKMLSQGRYHICNECVFLCADILRMELGDNFGGEP